MKTYPSIKQAGLNFWVEKIDNDDEDSVSMYHIVAQADGYPATEAISEWFAKEHDANQIAKMLANGEDI